MAANLAETMPAGPPNLARPRVPPVGELAGELGAQVAHSLSRALAELDRVLVGGTAAERGLRELIEHARHAAMLGQQVSRLAQGSVVQAPEPLDLPGLWRQVLRHRRGGLAQRGLEVRQRLRPAQVCLDPSLLYAVLDSLLDWIYEHCTGAVLHVATELQTWPAQAQLRCHFGWLPPHRDGDGQTDALDTLSWRLVQQAAAVMGVKCEREIAPARLRVTLTIPANARRWPLLDGGGVPDETDAADPAPVGLAGRSVLLLAPRPELQRAVLAALAPLGVELIASADAEGARRRSRQAVIDALVADAAAPGLDALCAELHAGGSGPALVLIGEEPAGVHLSTTTHTEVARTGLGSLASDLPRTLRFALR
jgi:hypothetical protein